MRGPHLEVDRWPSSCFSMFLLGLVACGGLAFSPSTSQHPCKAYRTKHKTQKYFQYELSLSPSLSLSLSLSPFQGKGRSSPFVDCAAIPMRPPPRSVGICTGSTTAEALRRASATTLRLWDKSPAESMHSPTTCEMMVQLAILNKRTRPQQVKKPHPFQTQLISALE